MKKTLFAIVCASFASAAFCLNVVLGTGTVKKPNKDGTNSDTGIGSAAKVFLCLTDAATYSKYASDTAGLYDAWGKGDFASAQYKYTGTTSSSSFLRYTIEDFPYNYDNDFYAIAVATYDSADNGRSYFIARAVHEEYKGDDPDFDDFTIGELISGAGKWEVIRPPLSDLECTSFAVSNGTVTVTYQVSDVTGLSKDDSVNFNVAYSLARNAGELSMTNLVGTIISVDAEASTPTFTATLKPDSEANSFFIFGIEE